MIDDSVAMTPFYLLLGKHRQQQQESQEAASSSSAERRPLPQGSVAIKEVSSALRGLRPLCRFMCNRHVNVCLTILAAGVQNQNISANE